MDEIAEQLLLEWARLGPAARIDVPDNTTRLTPDTNALGSFSYRLNSPRAVLARAQAHVDEVLEDTFLPTGMPVSVGELLSSYVELAVPATRIEPDYLADVAGDPPAQRRELESLAEDRERHAAEILDKLVPPGPAGTYPSCQLSFSSFVQLLTQLSPRRYSTSSSPLWRPDHATLTFTFIQAPAWPDRGVFEDAPSTRPPPGQARVTGRCHRAAALPRTAGSMSRTGSGPTGPTSSSCERNHQETTGAFETEAEAWIDEVERTHSR